MEHLLEKRNSQLISFLLRKSPACLCVHPHRLLGWKRPYRSSNWAVTCDWCQEGLSVSSPSPCGFFYSPSLSSNTITNIIQVFLYTCFFSLSKPHHGFRCHSEKNKIRLHLWPLRLTTELKWGGPAHRIGHTRWYNWPIIPPWQLCPADSETHGNDSFTRHPRGR